MYCLPRGETETYNALIDGRNFNDQPINDTKDSMMK